MLPPAAEPVAEDASVGHRRATAAGRSRVPADRGRLPTHRDARLANIEPSGPDAPSSCYARPPDAPRHGGRLWIDGWSNWRSEATRTPSMRSCAPPAIAASASRIRILRDVDLAEDAVQAAYVSAWRELRSLREPDRFESLAASDPDPGVLRGGPADAPARGEHPGPPQWTRATHPTTSSPSSIATSWNGGSAGSPSSNAPCWSSTTTSG